MELLIACVTFTLSKHNSNATQPASYGGIIADVMGLGKTLTMLTAILRSLPPTCNFDKGKESEMSTKTPTRATLVVVTSARKFRAV
jgi:SNF2 family DNA or RNA helicase